MDKMLNKTAQQGDEPAYPQQHQQHQQQPQQGISLAGHSTPRPWCRQKSPPKRKRSLSPATESSFKRRAAVDGCSPKEFQDYPTFNQKDLNQINDDIRARVLVGLIPSLVVMEDGLLRVVDGDPFQMPRPTVSGSSKEGCRDSLPNYRYATKLDNDTTAHEPQDLSLDPTRGSRQSLINGHQQEVHQDLYEQYDRHHCLGEEQYYPSPQHNQSQQQQLQQQPPADHDLPRKQLIVSKLEQRNINIPDLSDPGEQKKMKPWLMNSVRVLLEHLNKFGVCVVDDFLGEERGNQVLQEVQALQENDCFQDGQVMSGGGLYEPSIRSDKITWTDGVTPVNAPALRHLIQLLDSIVMTANRVPNNGELGKYRINGRTKAMVACYPGGGSHYVRHVDNPNRDGRVVTAIYYLNKDWNSQYDGGSLKIYTQVNNGAVAKVDPLFDRIAFFWSDSRNPHEVVPSNKNRLAVTVWYLDETEKRVYERRKQEAAAAAALQNIHNPR